MHKKYLSESSSSIITNDLFLAAFLASVGCTLDHVQPNERRRMSFVFVGERVLELREAYRTGPVHVDMRTFRENLNRLRDRLGSPECLDEARQPPEERSIAHAHVHRFARPSRLQLVPQH